MIPLALLERVSRQKFTHVGLTGVDCRRIMYDTIHDGVSDHPAAKAWMPLRGFVLCTEDRWPLVVSALEDFQKILSTGMAVSKSPDTGVTEPGILTS